MLTKVVTSKTARQFVKFAVGGGIGTACHYVTLIALVEVGALPVVWSTLAGFAVGAAVNYWIARSFIFRTDRSHVVALSRFLVVAALGATLNTLLVGWLYASGSHYLVAQVVATVVVFVWNFAANKLWSFGD